MTRSTAARQAMAEGAAALGLTGLLTVAHVALAVAAQGSGSVLMATQVNARVVVESDRNLVTIQPGRSVTVVVVVKVRLARGSAATVALNTPGADRSTAVRYEFAGNTGLVADHTVLGVVRSSGVHTLLLTMTLPPAARGPVTLPLLFRGGMSGTLPAAPAMLP